MAESAPTGLEALDLLTVPPHPESEEQLKISPHPPPQAKFAAEVAVQALWLSVWAAVIDAGGLKSHRPVLIRPISLGLWGNPSDIQVFRSTAEQDASRPPSCFS
jgi:hypothetical protein